MIELVFESRIRDADALSDLLMGLGALSVTVEDAQADSPDESPIFGEPGMPSEVQSWPSSRFAVLIDPAYDPQRFWQALCAEQPECADSPFEIRQVSERDWVSETQRQFTPFQVRDALWVGPHWTSPASALAPTGIEIRIDPGMAFGTGSHATTQLCLESLLDFSSPRSREALASCRMLDMGCGSGVLAIAAAKLGLGHVVAVDIDPIAVETTQKNAGLNQATLQAMTADAPLGGPFNMVMANILAQPLKVLAPALARLTADHGALVLSGILARQAEELLSHYGPLCAHLGPIQVLGERDGWVCIGTLGQPL